MRSPNASFYTTMTLIFTKCLYRTYFTSLNWVFGKPYLLIYFAFFMHVEEIKSRYSILGMHPLIFYHISTNTVARYRQIPTFGRDTIRCFHANVSAMKKLAARDWEDLLQVCHC